MADTASLALSCVLRQMGVLYRQQQRLEALVSHRFSAIDLQLSRLHVKMDLSNRSLQGLASRPWPAEGYVEMMHNEHDIDGVFYGTGASHVSRRWLWCY
jgi:hypothetical protein